MSAEATQSSLLARLRSIAHSENEPVEALVPVDDFGMYYLLCNEIVRTVLSEGSASGTTFFVDEHTAVHMDALDGARVSAREIFVLGTAPESWAGSPNVKAVPCRSTAEPRDLFLVVVSPVFCCSMVCERDEARFRGAWSSLRSHTLAFIESLSTLTGIDLCKGLPVPADEDVEPAGLTASLRLMALLSRQLHLRQRDMAIDKDILAGVLDVLKAISAERRAHDILYVFVEQIARAVNIDRCSVVRVWGNDARGYVLASHEDAGISNLPIDLQKYPEIARVIQTRQKVVINDTRRDTITRSVMQDIGKADIRSLIVIPVVLFDPGVGTLLLRAARRSGVFSLRDINFCEIVAEAAASALERAQLFENIQKANERLEYLAVTDGLTGLYNHRHFLHRLEEEFVRARRYSLPLSCLIMDVDNFKKINDVYGHLLGDTVLQGIANCTQEQVRKSDIVARYGGEEFVVIMPQTGLDGGRIQAERVCRAISELRLAGLPDDFRVTVSIGVAEFHPQLTPDCESLIRIADGALYRAKREGKNRVVVGQPEERPS